MNFSTVPPRRSSSVRTRSWYGVEERLDVLWIHRLRARGEPDEVAEDDRDDLALATRRGHQAVFGLPEQRLAAVDVEGRADRAVEVERLPRLLLALGVTAGLDQLLGGPQPEPCLPGRAAGLGPHLGGAHEVAVEAGERELLPRPRRGIREGFAELGLEADLPAARRGTRAAGLQTASSGCLPRELDQLLRKSARLLETNPCAASVAAAPPSCGQNLLRDRQRRAREQARDASPRAPRRCRHAHLGWSPGAHVPPPRGSAASLPRTRR